MIRFIDLFAGMGGTRIGFEQACSELGIKTKCVFTSEIKEHAVSIYRHNFGDEAVHGDITTIEANEIPDFDFLLGGFPCQAFSTAGRRLGFQDTRGTLFFDIARIIEDKRPRGFLLENVEGLVKHDLVNKGDEIGRTLSTILNVLSDMGYKVSWKVLNSKDFGIPQNRKRVYIVGSLVEEPTFDSFEQESCKLSDILEKGLPCENTPFRKKLLTMFKPSFLYGKAIKDKRGGEDNIHSWDLELKGKVTKAQKDLLNRLLKERRRKKWASEIGIKWMDGLPLTLEQIFSFYNHINKADLKEMLEDLVVKGYVKYEHPKELTVIDGVPKRVPNKDKPKGFNIVTGKLSFELNKILDPREIAPTIVATETHKLGVIDSTGIRNLSDRECLRLFGFPESYKVNICSNKLYDLVGNTVTVPVIKAVSKQVILASKLALGKAKAVA